MKKDGVTVVRGSRGLTIDVYRPSQNDYGQGSITLRGREEVRYVITELEAFLAETE